MILILILLLHQRRKEVREVGGRADADADADDVVDIITHVAHSHRQHGHAGRRSARRFQVSGSSAARNGKQQGTRARGAKRRGTSNPNPNPRGPLLLVTFFLPYPWTLPEKVPFIVVGAALYFFRSQPCFLFLQALDSVVVNLCAHMCIVVPLPLA